MSKGLKDFCTMNLYRLARVHPRWILSASGLGKVQLAEKAVISWLQSPDPRGPLIEKELFQDGLSHF